MLTGRDGSGSNWSCPDLGGDGIATGFDRSANKEIEFFALI
jgi:hypothetical protein